MSVSTTQLSSAIYTLTPGRVPTLQEMGDYFNLTRERIRQLLLARGLSKPHAYVANKLKCRVCNGELPASRRQQRDYICYTCQPKFYSVIVSCICGQCGIEFSLSRGKYNSRFRLVSGLRTTPRTTPLFCSQKCSGKYLGNYYGFAVHKQMYKYPGEGSQYMRKKALGICVKCASPAALAAVHCEKHLLKSRTRSAPSHRHRRTTTTTCVRCGKQFETNAQSLLMNERKHGTKNHYCKDCYTYRPHNLKLKGASIHEYLD